MFILIFKDIKGNRIDPLLHTSSLLKIHPQLKIYIGSDSQNLGKKQFIALLLPIDLETKVFTIYLIKKVNY